MSGIRAVREGAVGHITLARPEKRNALDQPMACALVDAIHGFGADPAVRVLLLTADGEDFCTGADLAALARLLDAGREANLTDIGALSAVIRTLRSIPQPVVAAVHGHAFGGGAGLATACDIVLAHADATFAYPEVRVGFVPAMVLTLLRRAVGEKRAADLVLTGRTFGADEAHAMGIVSRVLPAAAFRSEVEATTAALSAASPSALRLTKRVLYDLDGLAFAPALALGERVNLEARATADFRAGVERFVRPDSDR
jgi:methylglutaconyl-CoA hydratase